MNSTIVRQIANQTNIIPESVNGTLELIRNGASVPFIARYRKEKTGNLDEETITTIRDLHNKLLEIDKRRNVILQNIEQQGNLTDELKARIHDACSLDELEDLYLPFKSKRKTRAYKAVEKGLEQLARIVMSQNYRDSYQLAERFVSGEKGVGNVDEALAGARDIMASWINERLRARQKIRKLLWHYGRIQSQVRDEKQKEAAKYKDYFDYSEAIKRIPSHRYLAIIRGEQEGFLRVKLEVNQDDIYSALNEIFVTSDNESGRQVTLAVRDAVNRLMLPSMENEFRAVLKERSDEKAIHIFRSNLYQLLMSPPLGPKRTLAIDPGFKSGCKVVCLDRQGNLLDNATIYPHPPQRDDSMAAKKLRSLADIHKIEAIAIGNGTAGKETENFLQKVKFNRDLTAVMVNENGASVYSVSRIARREFPDYDVTVRGAVSVGRRLMDPLAELVKIDPKSIGVGQYQHDVDQKKLSQSLHDITMQCVNAVGVDVNTASHELLTYVSGIGSSLAQRIVDYRKKNGPFNHRKELKKVPDLGPKAFEQAAGFLRIYDGSFPLDASAVHPESYHIAGRMAEKAGMKTEDLIRNTRALKNIDPQEFVDEQTGLPTIRDILKELEKPGRDPRSGLKQFEFDRSLKSIEDVKPGMIVPGQVTNMTAFGCFVDIGIHENGLVHISELAERFVSDPAEVVSLNQYVSVKVLSVDRQRKRIQLSIKQAG